MKCFECGGELFKKKISVIFYKRDGAPVFFEDVLADECVQCGEKYLSGAITEKISVVLESTELSAKKHLSVPVVNLAA